MTSENSSVEETTIKTEPFRVAAEPEEATPLPETDSNQPIQSSEKADGVFIGYEVDNGVPYVADYFNIAETYKSDPAAYTEADEITQYLQDLVNTGQIDNTIDAVKAKLKQLEQLSGIEETDRVNMKLTRLAEYAKFENRINQAKRSAIKWSK